MVLESDSSKAALRALRIANQSTCDRGQISIIIDCKLSCAGAQGISGRGTKVTCALAIEVCPPVLHQCSHNCVAVPAKISCALSKARCGRSVD